MLAWVEGASVQTVGGCQWVRVNGQPYMHVDLLTHLDPTLRPLLREESKPGVVVILPPAP